MISEGRIGAKVGKSWAEVGKSWQKLAGVGRIWADSSALLKAPQNHLNRIVQNDGCTKPSHAPMQPILGLVRADFLIGWDL